MKKKNPVYVLALNCISNVYFFESQKTFNKRQSNKELSVAMIDQGIYKDMKAKTDRLNQKCRHED